MKKRQWIALYILVILLLVGCTEKAVCLDCGDRIDRWIETADKEPICASCILKNGYMLCKRCSSAYKPDDAECYDGYCKECAKLMTKECEKCGKRLWIGHLYSAGFQKYYCASCAYYYGSDTKNAAASNHRREGTEPKTVTVYITNTGSKYHRSGCQYLRKSCIKTTLASAQARGYTACSKCW